jgi:hypothetical protein
MARLRSRRSCTPTIHCVRPYLRISTTTKWHQALRSRDGHVAFPVGAEGARRRRYSCCGVQALGSKKRWAFPTFCQIQPTVQAWTVEVMQPESPAHLVQTAAASGISRGSSSEGMLDGVILSKAKAAFSPRKRHTKTPPPPVPRRSSHLARKACGCTPAVPVAQNILMKKLGIPVAQQLEAVDFEQYLRTFKGGL